MSAFSTLLCWVYIFHATALCELISLSILLHNVLLFHTSALCILIYHAVAPFLLIPHCFTVSNYSTQLHYIYLVPLMHYIFCVMSTHSTLLLYVNSFHISVLCLLFPHFCSMSTYSTLLYIFTSTLQRYCCMSTCSILLQNVYLFHAAALLIKCCCAMVFHSMST